MPWRGIFVGAHHGAPLQRDSGAIIHFGVRPRVMEENDWVGKLADGPVQFAAKYGGEVVSLKTQCEYSEGCPAYLDLRAARHHE